MLKVTDVSLSFGKRTLFKEVNLSFQKGNTYGVIGANGAGKSTFLKILSGEIEPNTGEIRTDPGERIAVLNQNHFAYEQGTVLDTVLIGHAELYSILKERDILYAKSEMTEAEGERAAELEGRFAELDGYEAESNAAILLKGLGILEDLHQRLMSELEGGQKVRVLLCQALFGDPDILLLDEPTNHLDIESVAWLEDYLSRSENTVIVVSHDRHFLNQVCTHTCDIDYSKIAIYTGNYDFWYQASQLAAQQRKDQNRRTEDKMNDLKSFITRFSSNASKAKQATSRRKLLDKMTLEDMPATSRKFPWVNFQMDRAPGKIILELDKVSVDAGDAGRVDNLTLTLNAGDKLALVGEYDTLKTQLFQILAGEVNPAAGSVKWGGTIAFNYFPKSNDKFFDTDYNLVDWLRQYSVEKEESFIRGFLGRMLFSGEEALKNSRVLSGGEKVRCMLSRMMLSNSNCLMLDEPTSHLDLESITALQKALENFPGPVIFATQDHEFAQAVTNRILEIKPGGYIDKSISFDEWLLTKKGTR